MPLEPIEMRMPTVCSRQRARRRAARVALATVTALLIVAPAVHAGTLLGGYVTPGCEGAPVWSIGYRLYWADTQGRALPRHDLNTVYDVTRQFTEAVGVATSCGVRVQVDLYDEGANPWPASIDRRAYPSDTAAFERAHGYDASFSRYPEIGTEEYGGVAQVVSEGPMRVKFPVAGTVLGSGAAWVHPGVSTLWHEWMHLVVGFYTTPRLGWPAQDVHGSCLHGYPSACAYGDERYFTDMAAGRVIENGLPRGMSRDEWAFYGTPARPRNRDPEVQLKWLGTRGYTWRDGVERSTSRIVFTYTDLRTMRRTYRERGDDGGLVLRPPMRPGLYRVCLTVTASETYRDARSCLRHRVRRDSEQARDWRARERYRAWKRRYG